jgi:hypothetical protein
MEYKTSMQEFDDSSKTNYLDMKLLDVRESRVSRFPSKCDSLDRKFNLTLNQNATPKDLLHRGLFIPLLRMSLMTRLKK